MKIKILKRFSIALISLSIIGYVVYVLACGPEPEEISPSSFFSQKIIKEKKYESFFRTSDAWYGRDILGSEGDAKINISNKNLEEWYDFFKKKINKDELEYIIYEAEIGEIDSLIFHIKDNKYPLPIHLEKPTLLNYPDKKVIKNFLYYLGFAKRCEPFATDCNENWYWDGWGFHKHSKFHHSNRNSALHCGDTTYINKLMSGGMKLYNGINNRYIKQRYLFQIVRLYYFNSDSKEGKCYDFYKEHEKDFKIENSSKYRAMGYAAAELYNNEKYAEANRLYAIIYDKCDAMKMAAFWSFHPQEEEDWDESLALAKNKREKEALWHLLGIYADPLRAMEEIYNLNPKSDLMDLLLVRAINENEERFLNSDSMEGQFFYNPSLVDTSLYKFVENVSDKKNTHKPYLWSLAAGYINLAMHQYDKSDMYFNEADKLSKGDNDVKEQIIKLRVTGELERTDKIDSKFEEKLVKEIGKFYNKQDTDVRMRYLNKFREYYNNDWNERILKWLAYKYTKQGNLLKATCFIDDLSFYGNMENYKLNYKNINELLAYIDNPKKSEFDKFAVELLPRTKTDIYELIAVDKLYNDELNEALKYFKLYEIKVDKDFHYSMFANPFDIRIKDCKECDYEVEEDSTNIKTSYTKYRNGKYITIHYREKPLYSKTSFALHMLELENAAKTDKVNAYKYYFELANGFYNISFFGNSGGIGNMQYQNPLMIKSYYYYNDVIANNLKTGNLHPRFDCSNAEKYYLKAMDLSKDKEFITKCCFMAAKCEHNRWLMSKQDWRIDFVAGKYFKMLKESFINTKYYQEIIKECGYFRTYVEKSK